MSDPKQTAPAGAERKQEAAGARAATLERDIDRTRSELGETVTALQEKLDPTALREKALREIDAVEVRVKDAVRDQLQETKAAIKLELVEAKDNVKREVLDGLVQARQALRAATIGKVENMARLANDRTVEARDSLLETVWRNPLPAALAGVGLTWLYMNRRGSTPRVREYYAGSEWRRPAGVGRDHDGGALRGARETAGRVMHGAKQKASELAGAAGATAEHASQTAGQLAHDTADAAGRLAHQVSEGASHMVEDAREVTSELTERAGRQLGRVDRAVREAMDTNPFAVAAACLAAGALVGLALPRTEREDEWMGGARDRLLDRASSAAQEGVERARQAAHGLGEIRDAAQGKPESKPGNR